MASKPGKRGRKPAEGTEAWILEQQSKELQEANDNLNKVCKLKMLDVAPGVSEAQQSKAI